MMIPASLTEALQKLAPHTDEQLAAFSDALQPQVFEKGAFICREGQVENYIYFIEKGIGRSFFLNDGREYTLEFYFDGEFACSYTSFLTREPSDVNLQALQETHAWKIPHRTIYSLYDRFHGSERIGRLIAEMQFIRRSRKEMELLSLSAEDRYRALFSRHPHLVSLISVKHLSSYLGIHPESLSRIRNKISGKG